jgi:hypothetical protein
MLQSFLSAPLPHHLLMLFVHVLELITTIVIIFLTHCGCIADQRSTDSAQRRQMWVSPPQTIPCVEV